MPWNAATGRKAGPFEPLPPFLHGLNSAEDTPKLALEPFAGHTAPMGIMQRFHVEDPRLDDSVRGARPSRAFRLTPESEGVAPRHSSPPKDPMDFADFRARMIERYAPSQPTRRAAVA